MNDKVDEQNALALELEELNLSELRKKAKVNYGLAITREHKEDEIRALIKQEAAKFDFAVEAVGDLKPGLARIKLAQVPGKSKAPAYLNINGKSFGIPVGIECDVPHKVVYGLRNALESVPVLDQDNVVTGFTMEESYPFSLIEMKPGPDPRPGLEVQREARLAPKRAFAEEHGYWPSDAVMAQQRQLAFIKSA